MLVLSLKKCALFTICFLLVSSYAYADHNECNGPRGFNNLLTSITQIQNKGKDNQYVKLNGRLTNYLGDDCYEFVDGQGNAIEIEIDDDIDWSSVHKDQLIEICGKIDKDLFVLKIEAKSFRLLEIPQNHNQHLERAK